ncbi:MAG: alpha/beta hydrolase [Balneola sp.]|jgi:pimeloyl-ACP methyl ester carboxylesterase
MKRFGKILKWTLLSFGLLIAVALIYAHNLNFSMSDEDINSALSGLPYKPEASFVSFEDRDIHYVAIGDTSKPNVLFIHGSPGSWDNFLDFMRNPVLLSKFRLISVDRPGFGRSGIGNPERSLEKQAQLINKVLEIEQSSSSILVGHSYGGPVIAKMAIEYPDKIDGVIFVAASIDPELEKTKWFQIPVHHKTLSWILPDILYSTNEEIIALKKELEDLIPLWRFITQPTSIIQGKNDNLVPFENALFGKKMLVNSSPKMVIRDMNHFIPWENPGLITQEILRLDSLINQR